MFVYAEIANILSRVTLTKFDCHNFVGSFSVFLRWFDLLVLAVVLVIFDGQSID